MLAVLITLAVVALFVVVNTFRGRRKVEPAFLAWIAAMHFATIPIRTFLPGSPPPVPRHRGRGSISPWCSG